MARAWVGLLLAACSRTIPEIPEVAPEPAPERALPERAIDGEPVLVVRLRSLDEAAGELRVTPQEGAAFAVDRAGTKDLIPYPAYFKVGEAAYLGGLEWRDGMLLHRVALENYVLGVMRGEIALGDVPLEAAKAQAIAARSYALDAWRKRSPRYDLDDTTLFQRYVGLRYAKIDALLRDGVQATRGLYLEFDGGPLKAYFHSTCGGHTTDVRTGLDREPLAPMSGVPCEYCRLSRHYAWRESIPDGTIVKAAGLEGALTGFEVIERGSGGRARLVRVEAGGRRREMKANEFRLAAGPQLLRSTRILAMRHEGGAYVVEGAGWGHGVGLCQMGAIGFAKEGASCERILAHYYTGASVARAY